MDPESRRPTQESKTLEAMVAIYCHGEHGRKDELCDDCSALLDYALKRLEKCSFGDDKPKCSACPIHCYGPDMRERIRKVMAYAGPRMLHRHPVMAVRHMLHGVARKPGKPGVAAT